MRSFFERHGLANESIQNKYKSAAAAYYRERIRALKAGEEPPSEATIDEYDRVAEWKPGMAAPAAPAARPTNPSAGTERRGPHMGGTGVTFESGGDSAVTAGMGAVSDT